MKRVVALCCVIVVLVGCDQKPNKSPSTTSSVNPRLASVSTPADVPFSFSDTTKSLGIAVTYHNDEEARRYTILESLGGGVGIFDYDNDGILDLVFPGGGGFVAGRDELYGLPTQLLRGQGKSPFQTVTAPSGLDYSPYYTHGVAIADVDNDGFSDLLVTGYGGVQLWRNYGDGTFGESAQASGLTDSRWSSSAAWGDLNGDGDVDLYIAHYVDWSFANNPACPGPTKETPDVCPPRQFNGIDDIVYFSNGDGQFRDATKEAGLKPGGKGLGVVMADFDRDLDLDIYVANDTENNFLYWNDGHGRLTEEGMLSGVAVDDHGVANGSMGVAVADFDGDQQLDIFVANYEDEAFALYRQVAKRQFLHVSQQSGIASLGVSNVGFGSVMVDIDADGDPDVVVTNGHIMHFPRSAAVRQKVTLLKNHLGRRFERIELNEPDYLSTGHVGRGLAMGDLNGDGSPDFVFSNSNEPAAVLYNTTPLIGRRIQVRLIGRKSNRDGIGATVSLVTDRTKQVQSVYGGGSYLSASSISIPLTFLQTELETVTIQVDWPSGEQTALTKSLTSNDSNGPILIVEPLSN